MALLTHFLRQRLFVSLAIVIHRHKTKILIWEAVIKWHEVKENSTQPAIKFRGKLNSSSIKGITVRFSILQIGTLQWRREPGVFGGRLRISKANALFSLNTRYCMQGTKKKSLAQAGRQKSDILDRRSKGWRECWNEFTCLS